MPIRPENRHFYKTPEWKAAKAAVIQRASGKCEHCGVPNGELIIRDRDGDWVEDYEFARTCSFYDIPEGNKFVRIVLTVAHMDQNPANNALENLKHLCQKCHNTLDAPFRALNRQKNKGQVEIV